MATIQALLNQSEVSLKVADAANEGDLFFEKYIQLSEAASLLAIARCLNHIVDHGIPIHTPAPSPQVQSSAPRPITKPDLE